MGLLSEIFSWWGGNTWGTRLFTWRKGRLVGEDEFGNRYYVQARGVGPLGVPARWVIYPKLSEASQVPPDWHGWMHYMFEAPPTEAPLPRQSWERPHRPNMTGTIFAYHPPGSIARDGEPSGEPAYEAWKPNP